MGWLGWLCWLGLRLVLFSEKVGIEGVIMLVGWYIVKLIEVDVTLFDLVHHFFEVGLLLVVGWFCEEVEFERRHNYLTYQNNQFLLSTLSLLLTFKNDITTRTNDR